ncbi:MAG: hypothetical protein CH6_1357 [Candidatus Kapaibacterium sp.]|nr:MAG: hypothetical protein CH6_1357 [Candidatus Kapabacteria bacterium]
MEAFTKTNLDSVGEICIEGDKLFGRINYTKQKLIWFTKEYFQRIFILYKISFYLNSLR